MPNPLYEQMGGRANSRMGQFQTMMSAFQEFKASFKGNARQEIQELLNSGRMTQQQYNELQQMAMNLSQMMGR